jgi:hypothetical protein
MIKGQQSWIRVRGAPNDPESFDLATWNGYCWEIERLNSLGDLIRVRIPNYIVSESLPESSNPESLFKEALRPVEGASACQIRPPERKDEPG